jgi:hypothetical protein
MTHQQFCDKNLELGNIEDELQVASINELERLNCEIVSVGQTVTIRIL